ncbi:tRNA lysidine(34) synthetase TilS [Bacteroidota bacterium]|nr:tRNA lysidine(34) synthetase TilS [Bacteroidota bacterium]
MSLTSNINKDFLAFFEQHKIKINSKFLIGVSGGSDSMALLDIGVKAGLKISVANVNYQLRNEESERESLIVKQYCLDNKLNFYSKEAEINPIKNIQNEAREIRYQFFNDLLEENKLDYILTAHHQNDNHETFFFNALKGNGIGSLKGIPEKNGIILRPLLQFTKTQLLMHVQENKIKFRTDSSNLTSKYERNFIRNEVFQRLSNKFPKFEQGLTNSINFLKEDYSLLNQLVEKIIHTQLEKRENHTLINFNNNIPKQTWFHFFKKFGFNYSQINNWVESNSQSGKFIESSTHRISKDRENWILSKKTSFKKNNKIFHIGKNETIETPIKITNHLCKTISFEKSNKNVEFFNSSKLDFPLKLRKWKSGDKIQPLGMKGSKKVSDILIDFKISILEKENIYVLESNNDIIWIIGILINDKYKVDNNCSIYCKVVYQEN